MTPNIKNYAKPRPFWMMVTGDTMIYAGTSITGMSIFADNHTWAYISLGCSVSGYFFTKLFAAKVGELVGQPPNQN